jgi:hypothetical protein
MADTIRRQYVDVERLARLERAIAEIQRDVRTLEEADKNAATRVENALNGVRTRMNVIGCRLGQGGGSGVRSVKKNNPDQLRYCGTLMIRHVEGGYIIKGEYRVAYVIRGSGRLPFNRVLQTLPSLLECVQEYFGGDAGNLKGDEHAG